jgi:hypothetical protein
VVRLALTCRRRGRPPGRCRRPTGSGRPVWGTWQRIG